MHLASFFHSFSGIENELRKKSRTPALLWLLACVYLSSQCLFVDDEEDDARDDRLGHVFQVQVDVIFEINIGFSLLVAVVVFRLLLFFFFIIFDFHFNRS